MLTIAMENRSQPMTKWAGLSDMYVFVRSDYRYYLGRRCYADGLHVIPCSMVRMETPRDARVALC